jgi:hypothetical protein
MFWVFLVVLLLISVFLLLTLYALRCRSLDRWIFSYAVHTGRRRPRRSAEPTHLLLCIADHYEPCWGNPPASVAQARADRWVKQYPERLGHFRDSDGRPPRHTFFYPIDEYVAEHVDAIAELCRGGFGEMEVHLHHDGDTPQNLRSRLLQFKAILSERHGQLARRKNTGELTYGFAHGNWALNNSRPDGRWCGVNNEIEILRETGCYADFTLPSAPSPTQTSKINSIYYASSCVDRPKFHNTGVDVGCGAAPPNSIVLIQGPLLLNWHDRKWSLLPRLENGCLQANQLPCIDRLRLWLQARIQIPSRPDWFFVKLHTHGAPEANADVLLGEPMRQFHQGLADLAANDPQFHFHYLTAREMYNLVLAAEATWQGTVADALDFELTWNSRSK